MEHKLSTPVSKDAVLSLSAGDTVVLSGTIYTMRDKAVKHILENGAPKGVELEGAVIYHCGPIISKKDVVSAGPTTSSRMNENTVKLLSKHGISLIVGKGGMNSAVLDAMKGKCAYLSATGGCGASLAAKLRLKRVFLEELGMAEALWVLEAKEFGPMIVTMDSKGTSMYSDVEAKVAKNLERELR